MKFNLKNVFLSIGVLVLSFVMFAGKADAVAISSNGTGGGAFGSTSTWAGGVVPSAADDITIVSGDTVTVADDTTDTTGSITIDDGGALTVSGTLTVTDPAFVANNGTLTVTTSLTGDGTVTNGATGVLNIGGAVDVTTLTATVSGNIVNYTGAGQTCKATTYYNLRFTGSGSVTCAPVATTNILTSGTPSWTLSSAFTNAGTLTVGSGTTIITAGFAFTVSGVTTINGGTLTLTNNTGAKTFTGLVTVNSGTLNGASTNIITSAGIANVAGTVSITGTDTIGTAGATFSGTNAIANLIISTGTTTNSGTMTISGALTVNGAMTNSGTLTAAAVAASSNTLTNSGTATITTFSGTLVGLTNTGTLNLAGATTAAADITTLTAGTAGTVNYNLAGNQTIKTGTYYDLTLSGGGSAVKTILATTTVVHDLSIAASTIASLTNGGSSTANGLKFAGNYQHGGSWGGADSAATQKSATYFAGTVTGIVTVAVSHTGGNPNEETIIVIPATPAVAQSTVPVTIQITPEITMVTTSPGCSGGNLFNTSTGAACVNNPAVPEGCGGGKAFSPVTGQACPASSTTTVTTTTTTTTTYNFGTTTLKNGSRGEAVKELQRFLNAKLSLGLVVDGILGPKTIKVIKQWQKDRGLVADGLIGAKTKAKMNAEAN
ncbi:MAG: peptidoglycan-binding protein [Candidatus Paceibacterota bacterium]|jgi:hypothetical protein